MKKEHFFLYGYLTFIFLMVFSSACSNVSVTSNNGIKDTPPINKGVKDNPPINGKFLTIDMTDNEILSVFGIDPAKATAKKSKGPDGYSTTYEQGPQTVSIAHSAVTGTTVIAFGPIKGDWYLGK